MRIPDKYFFICESVEDLVRWCYPDILSLLFQYTFRKAIAPKNHAVNHIHILTLSLMISEIFIFDSADSVKSGEQAGTFAVEYRYSTSASGLPPNSPFKGCQVTCFATGCFAHGQIYVALTQRKSSKKTF